MAKKAAKSQATEVQAPKAKALDKCKPYTEKVRLMVLEVLREESAHELNNQARFEEKEFDWQAYNKQFRVDYQTTELKVLLSYARNLYGLNDIAQIRERRKAHKQRRAQNVKNQNLIGYAPALVEQEIVQPEIEDIDELIDLSEDFDS